MLGYYHTWGSYSGGGNRGRRYINLPRKKYIQKVEKEALELGVKFKPHSKWKLKIEL